jgi:hypothetical protein
MKKLLLALALGVCTLALAAPVLTADPYPSTALQPTAASVAGGGQTIACTLPSTSGGLVPTCDLVSFTTAPGTTSLVLTVSNPAANPTSSSSAPFSFTWRGTSYATPTMSLTAINGVPMLVSQIYPSTALAPTSASMTGGPSAVTCTVPAVTGGTRVQCSLASITATGSYSLVVASSVPYGCAAVTGGATCNGAGSASSSPFPYSLAGSLATPTGIRVQ